MTSVSPTIGMPLEEIMQGNQIQLISSNGEKPFSQSVLAAAGMDVSVMAPTPDNKPAGQKLSSDISSLVLGDQRNTNKGPAR